jgi:ubiquinone biosynthesis protein Coq4
MSQWFNVFRNELGNVRDILTLDDVVTKNEATQVVVRCSRDIDEPRSSSR